MPCSTAPNCGGYDNNPVVQWQPVNGTAVVFLRQQDDLDITNFVFALIFIFEMVLKIAALGVRGYCVSDFNKFDGVVVLLSIVAQCAAFSTIGRVSSGGSCIDEPDEVIAEEAAKLGAEYAQFKTCADISEAGGCERADAKAATSKSRRKKDS